MTAAGDGSGMRLHYTPGSCVLSCHIALEWAEADHAAVRWTQQEIHGPDYARINPKRKVPALEIEDDVLTEAAAILVHIAEAARSDLMPPPGLPRGHMLEALSELTGEFHPAFAPLHVPDRYVADEDCHDGVREAAETRIRAHYDRWNVHMADRAYILGAEPSVADPYLYVMCRWAGAIGAVLGEAWPDLARFAARLEDWDATRDAVEAQGLDLAAEGDGDAD